MTEDFWWDTADHSRVQLDAINCSAQGQLDTSKNSSHYASNVNVEPGIWLFLIEARRDQNGLGPTGLLRGISLSGYLLLVNWSSRLIRPGKVNLSSAVPDILTRLNIDADDWKETLQRLLGPNKKIGSYFGGTDRLSEVAKQRGCKFVKNIAGRDVPLTSPSAG